MTDTKKPTKPQIKALADLFELGGCVITSQWTTGSGRHITRRTIPLFCDRVSVAAVLRTPKEYPARIRRVAQAHPRAIEIVAITDMRSAKRALRPH